MMKYLFWAFLVVLSGCATAKLELSDLPQPVYVDESNGTTYSSPSSQFPPANALSYNQIDTLVKGSNYYQDEVPSYKSLNHTASYTPDLRRTQGNIIFHPDGRSDYVISYRGDSFVPNSQGFAEQTTGAIPKPEIDWGYTGWDGLVMTKLVLGGGVTGLNYVDFGYWIGIPKNTTKKPVYEAFATRTTAPGYSYGSGDLVSANTSYSGRAAGIAVDNNVTGSARELGGTATLTIDGSKHAHLNLAFQNYYTFDIYSNYSYGGGITSVSVTGTNSNGGPAFSSCPSGCSASANYTYVGQYQGDEVVGTYKYTSGNSSLIGSFGASLD